MADLKIWATRPTRRRRHARHREPRPVWKTDVFFQGWP